MAVFSPQCLLLSGLVIMVSGCRADSPLTVTAFREEDKTLPCFKAITTDPKSGDRFRWMKHSADTGQMEVILTWPPQSHLAKRVKWVVDGEGQMSLLLTNVQKSDEGLYSCEMCQGWDCTLVKNILLVVKASCSGSHCSQKCLSMSLQPPLTSSFSAPGGHHFKADSPLTAFRGENATLPCFKANTMDPKSGNRFRWMKRSADTGEMEVVLTWPPQSHLALRVKWDVEEKEQMSLLLTNVRKSDEGLYSCEMCHGWDCTRVKNTSLVVKDCKVMTALKATTSKPIELKCPVDETSRPQNISWFLVKGGEPQSLPSERVQVNLTSLVILAVRAGDTGWYRCNYTDKQTQRCFDVKIQVQDAVEVTPIPVTAAQTQQALTNTGPFSEKSQEESGGTVVAVVSSVVIGIVVTAAAVIGLFLYYCRDTQRLPQQTQSSPAAGTLMQSDNEYETMPCSDDPLNLRVNSIYHQYDTETPITFHY